MSQTFLFPRINIFRKQHNIKPGYFREQKNSSIFQFNTSINLKSNSFGTVVQYQKYISYVIIIPASKWIIPCSLIVIQKKSIAKPNEMPQKQLSP